MRVKLFWKNEPLKAGAGFFKSALSGGNALELEAEINKWLADNPDIEIVAVKQSASGGSFAHSLWLISIWYNDNS